MFRYYLDLALRSFRRARVLTALMVLALALGIGASMTTLTVFHVLSADPLPAKSGRLFYVQLDAGDLASAPPGSEPLEQVTRLDAETLLREHRAPRQALMTGGGFVAQSQRDDIKPFFARARYTSAGFFPMFEVPLRYGRAWGAEDDEAAARVVVIGEQLNQRLFGGVDSTGRTLRIAGHELRIVGVMAHWRPVPHFYDLNGYGIYGDSEDAYVPFSTAMALKLPIMGSLNCWGNGNPPDRRASGAPCSWLQYWVELPSPAQAAAYRQYLVNYSETQRAAGRYVRPTNVRLRTVREWMDFKQVVPGDVRLQMWLAFGFLAVCLVNTVGLLLAKCLRRAPEIGVRRALGASRRAIFAQFLVEAGVIGVAGGVLGLGLALLGLWGVRQNPASYAQLAQLDVPMLASTLGVALLASVAAGLLPAWRACQVTPALQLKSQ
jgi:putative ABC transport system permease protein